MRAYPQEVVDRMRRLYETHGSLTTVGAIMGIDPDIISRAKRRGWKSGRPGQAATPMPSDFPLMANRLTIKQLCAHYRAGQGSVYRWLGQIERNYEPRSSSHGSKPIPVGFESVLREHGPTKAAAILGVDPNTLQKWREQKGLPVARKRKKATDQRNWAEQYYLRKAA